MGDASLASLLNAPIAFYTPEVLAGAPVAEGTRFELYDSRAAAIAAADGPHLAYLTYFPGPIRGLTPGTPVQMKGVQVGRVRDVRLRYMPETAIAGDAGDAGDRSARAGVPRTDGTTREELRARMNDALQQLVRQGHAGARWRPAWCCPGRARCRSRSSPRRARPLVVDERPADHPGRRGRRAGWTGAMAAVTEVAEHDRSLPLREIAARPCAARAPERLDALVSDPAARCRACGVAGNSATLGRERRRSPSGRQRPAGQNIGPDRESLRKRRRRRPSRRQESRAAPRHFAEAELRRRGADPRADPRGRSRPRRWPSISVRIPTR